MIDSSSLRRLFLFTVMVVRAVLWLKEFLKAASSLSANLFRLGLSSGEGIDTRIAFLLMLAGFVGLRFPSLLRRCSCIWSVLSCRKTPLWLTIFVAKALMSSSVLSFCCSWVRMFRPSTFLSLSAFSSCRAFTISESFRSKASVMSSMLMSAAKRPKLINSSGRMLSLSWRAMIGISILSVLSSCSNSDMVSSSLTSMMAPFMSSSPLFTLRCAVTRRSVSLMASFIFMPKAEMSASIFPSSLNTFAASFLANSSATMRVLEV